jgi:hypothetical protein
MSDRATDGVDAEATASRVSEVGWYVDGAERGAWAAPQPIRVAGESEASKSVAVCPAVIESDRRNFVIPCPVDLHVRLGPTPEGMPRLLDILAGGRPAQETGGLLVLAPAAEWRHPRRPIVRAATPYRFVSDDPVHLNSFPPFLHYQPAPRPGLQLCERFPIHAAPRRIVWSFEWHDVLKDLVVKRGEPWFYVRFNGGDPSAQVRFVEAERAPELMTYVDSLTDVPTTSTAPSR